MNFSTRVPIVRFFRPSVFVSLGLACISDSADIAFEPLLPALVAAPQVLLPKSHVLLCVPIHTVTDPRYTYTSAEEFPKNARRDRGATRRKGERAGLRVCVWAGERTTLLVH